MQPVLPYLRQSSRGYATQVVTEALAACGYPPESMKDEAIVLLIGRLALAIQLEAGRTDLHEPALPKSDVAGEPAKADLPKSEDSVSEDEGGPEVLEERPLPPPLRRRK